MQTKELKHMKKEFKQLGKSLKYDWDSVALIREIRKNKGFIRVWEK